MSKQHSLPGQESCARVRAGVMLTAIKWGKNAVKDMKDIERSTLTHSPLLL